MTNNEDTEFGRRYEGWASRETWAAQLWLANDEGTYNLVRSMAADALEEATEDHPEYATVTQHATYLLSQALDELYESWADTVYESAETAETHATMVRDIGSAWRIDWHEIAGHWVNDEFMEQLRDGHTS